MSPETHQLAVEILEATGVEYSAEVEASPEWRDAVEHAHDVSPARWRSSSVASEVAERLSAAMSAICRVSIQVRWSYRQFRLVCARVDGAPLPAGAEDVFERLLRGSITPEQMRWL